jgi:hypothetical protein
MRAQHKLTYSMAAILAFAMCGLPEAMQAQQSSSQTPSSTQQQQAPSNQGVTVNPAQAPLSPLPAPEPQPGTETTQSQPSTPATILNAPPSQQQGQHEPLGTAVAGGIATAGGGASRPAGTAIAPAKQHQVRSFLLKFGAIAAAGAAIGTVYALSRGTSSRPPNAVP